MNDPRITADMKRFVKLSKDYKDLQPVIKAYHDYRTLLDNIAGCKDLLATEKDEDMREMAKEEAKGLEEGIEQLEGGMKILLLPKDPNDDKNVILEVRAGTGGEEAALFGTITPYRCSEKFDHFVRNFACTYCFPALKYFFCVTDRKLGVTVRRIKTIIAILHIHQFMKRMTRPLRFGIR